jgi:hypothetical protein
MAAVLNRRDAESSLDAERSFGIAFRAAPDGAIQRFGELKKIGCKRKKMVPFSRVRLSGPSDLSAEALD